MTTLDYEAVHSHETTAEVTNVKFLCLLPHILSGSMNTQTELYSFATSTHKHHLELPHVSFAFIPLKLLATVVKVFAVFSAN